MHNVHIIFVNCPEKGQGGNLHKAKGECLNRVHSDQMDLGIVNERLDLVRGGQNHSELS
jgi:hypothetical protein